MVIEYNGSFFHGWQKQLNANSVQEELTTAVREALHVNSSEDNFISGLTAAGRTDAGVHARAQVVVFRTNIQIYPHSFMLAVSNILKGKVSVLTIEKVAADFHPLTSAVARQYQYVILNRASPPVIEAGMCWHVPKPLDLSRLNRDAAVLVGEHDFTSFRGRGCVAKNPVKTVYISSFEKQGDKLIYTIKGKGFLKQMVRNIVGTLVRLNQDKLKIKTIEEVLAVKDRTKAGICAPAAGLFFDFVEF